MPKIPQLTPRQILHILEKKGFQIDHVTGSHYILYHPTTKARVTVAYHTKALPKGTIHFTLFLNQQDLRYKTLRRILRRSYENQWPLEIILSVR